MDENYPPLPSATSIHSNATPSSSISRARKAMTPNNEISSIFSDHGRLKKNVHTHSIEELNSASTNSVYRVISPHGDIILEHEDFQLSKRREMRYQWRVSTEKLMQNSRYFAALLAPNKFSEGQVLLAEKSKIKQTKSSAGSLFSMEDEVTIVQLNSAAEDILQLPILNFKVSRSLGKQKVEVLETFLGCLCHHPSNIHESSTAELHETLRQSSISFIAVLIDVADQFSSSNTVRAVLKAAGYTPSVSRKLSLRSFSSSLLKLSEERIRQSIYVTRFLGDTVAFKILTHTLILMGSSSWVHGLGLPTSDALLWSYLPEGVEEELYYRRQSVLNTLTDLQAYFLRLYGGMDDEFEAKSSGHFATNYGMPTNKDKPFQCRAGFTNSQACDAFHLGQMMRFFAVRAKTIFIGSTLIDPDFEIEEGGETENDDPTLKNHDDTARNSSSHLPGDIYQIIASLRQIPDYQIDVNHNGCGIRRRVLPSLDCIERYTGDGDALLGLVLRSWDPNDLAPDNLNSWRAKELIRAERVDIRYSKIVSITSPSLSSHQATKGQPLIPFRSPGIPSEDARLLFTARRRNWEA